MTDVELALFSAVEHYADLLSTPHSDIRRWRRRLFRAKAAIHVLSQMAEGTAGKRRRRLH